MQSEKEAKLVSPLLRPSFKCGACIFWEEVDPGATPVIGQPARGLCFGAPPQVIPIVNNGQVVGGQNIRPLTLKTDKACGIGVGRAIVAKTAN